MSNIESWFLDNEENICQKCGPVVTHFCPCSFLLTALFSYKRKEGSILLNRSAISYRFRTTFCSSLMFNPHNLLSVLRLWNRNRRTLSTLLKALKLSCLTFIFSSKCISFNELYDNVNCVNVKLCFYLLVYHSLPFYWKNFGEYKNSWNRFSKSFLAIWRRSFMTALYGLTLVALLSGRHILFSKFQIMLWYVQNYIVSAFQDMFLKI